MTPSPTWREVARRHPLAENEVANLIASFGPCRDRLALGRRTVANLRRLLSGPALAAAVGRVAELVRRSPAELLEGGGGE